MAIMMVMHWPGATPEQYEALRKQANWEHDLPRGAKLHIVGFGSDGLHITDIWESAEDFQAFNEQRIAPAVQELAITSKPDVTILPLHGVFAPALGQPTQTATL